MESGTPISVAFSISSLTMRAIILLAAFVLMFGIIQAKEKPWILQPPSQDRMESGTPMEFTGTLSPDLSDLNEDGVLSSVAAPSMLRFGGQRGWWTEKKMQG